MKSMCTVMVMVMVFLGFPLIGNAQETSLMSTIALEQPADGLDSIKGVVAYGLENNPDVLGRWQSFQAVQAEQRSARGEYLPQLDLTARSGYESYRSDGDTTEYQPGEVSLALTQMLYDGFTTRNEVERLGAVKLIRFYELLDASESTALAIVNAYIDVLRYRNLLAYAEENLHQHEEVYAQVEERVQAGISRGVDLDQATGRLALARANRMTEANNLHDVSARFLRLVGTLPQRGLLPPARLAQLPLPESIEEALLVAYQNNPAICAAFEEVAAADKAKRIRQAAYHPRVELRAHHEIGEDRDRIQGDSNESVVELVASFNLYNGGSDSAKIQQFVHQFNQAIDVRNTTCRNVRQTLSIAMNHIEHLKVQLNYLKAHLSSSEKARSAYRDQFNIGQRTLLDLLDTENEYFQARRSYTIASYDFVLEHARSAAAMGHLLETLELRSRSAATLSELGHERDGVSVEQFCSVQGIPKNLSQESEISEQPWLH